jgi:membrane-associated phospholipid phosphatase
MHRLSSLDEQTRRRIGLSLAVAGLIWAVLTAAGTALERLGARLVDWDGDFVAQVEAMRSPELDAATHIGSSLSNTEVCIAVATIALIAFRLWLGRWREGLIVVAAILGELLIFLAITGSIERARPEVKALDVAPPTSSFPSGHVGAAVALYGTIAVILLVMRPGFWPTSMLAILLLFIPTIVAISRVYRGMHFPTDVVAGAIGGGSWLVVCILLFVSTLRRDEARTSRDSSEAITDGAPVGVERQVEHGPRP